LKQTVWYDCYHLLGTTREDVLLALESANIESSPVWKPLHLQPAFAGCRVSAGEAAEDAFERGFCLPAACRQALMHQIEPRHLVLERRTVVCLASPHPWTASGSR